MFKYVLLILSFTAFAPTWATQSPAHAAAEKASGTPQVQDLATAFSNLWDATKDLPVAEKVARFRKEIEPQFPAFYGIERYDGKVSQAQRDEQIAKAFEQFGPIREAYRAKTQSFDAKLSENISTFKKAFPDFKTTVPIHVVHSFGEMDGGTRDFHGTTHLIFGVDGMVRYHKGDDDSAFFHHELFHVYHEPRLGECELIWCSLWAEGLAVYVAQTLHPQATEDELLLSLPADMVANTQRQLVPALEDLKRSLYASENDAVYKSLFQSQTSSTGLPGRRGYYLGYLVAKELARTHSVQALANMRAAQALPLVAQAIDTLLLSGK